MCGHHGYNEESTRAFHCGPYHRGCCHRNHESFPHFHGHHWGLMTHNERVEALVQIKKSLEERLADIQKTLDLLQRNSPSENNPTSQS